MVKNIGILVEEDYEDLELWYPYLRLQEEGLKVLIIDTGRLEKYLSKHGYEVTSDLTAEEADPEDFDGVVIPGGWAPDRLRRHSSVNELVRAIFDQGGVVASICHGGSVLVSAGVLKGKKVTSVSAIKDDMVNAGARWIDQEVVVDKNLITSRRPSDLPAFLKEIIKALAEGS